MHFINDCEALAADPRRTVSGSRIRITGVTTADNAVFQCMAANEHGSILANAVLTVIGKIYPQAPFTRRNLTQDLRAIYSTVQKSSICSGLRFDVNF